MEANVTWCIVQEPKYKPANEVIHLLCDVVAKNGNLLLNVGPQTDGSFHPDARSVLYSIGDWLAICGEAIYNTRPWKIAAEGPTGVQDNNYDVTRIEEQLRKGGASDIRNDGFGSHDFRFTFRENAVYAIALGKPENGQYVVRALSRKHMPQIAHITLLGSSEQIDYVQNDRELIVMLPQTLPGDYAWVLKVIQ